MKIIITGAKGMLAQELAKEFASAQLLLWDREELDITDQALVMGKIAQEKPDLIINTASYNNVDAVEVDDFALADAINTQGPINLATACSACGATLIHYSTDYVFDGENQAGYDELAEPKPLSAYGRTKLGGEAVLNFNDKTYLIRTSRLFGFPAKGENAKKSFVDIMLKLGPEKKELSLVDEEKSCPTYVVDLAKQTKFLLEKNYPFGIYHITNSGACTWFGFANEIFRQAGLSVKTIPVSSSNYPRPARRPNLSELINTKLPPLRSWQEALADYLKNLI